MIKLLIGLLVLLSLPAFAEESNNAKCKLDVVMELQATQTAGKEFFRRLEANDMQTVQEIVFKMTELAEVVCKDLE